MKQRCFELLDKFIGLMNKNLYIAFHKPFGVLSQFISEGDHKRLDAFDFPKTVYAAGRLDKDSEGLLLLSNDGPFIEKLLNPKFNHSRTYLVQVEGVPDQKTVAELAKGVEIKGYKTKKCIVEQLRSSPDVDPRIPPIRQRKAIPTSWLKMTLTEGKNRQVRRMTASVGFPTLRLIRLSIGKLSLGDLPLGAWKYVEKTDILPNR